jgi:hypothetical protein
MTDGFICKLCNLTSASAQMHPRGMYTEGTCLTLVPQLKRLTQAVYILLLPPIQIFFNPFSCSIIFSSYPHRLCTSKNAHQPNIDGCRFTPFVNLLPRDVIRSTARYRLRVHTLRFETATWNSRLNAFVIQTCHAQSCC